jgi:prefoldin subunit 5
MVQYKRIQFSQRRSLKQRKIRKNNELRSSYNRIQNCVNELRASYNRIQISKNKLSQILIDRVHNYINHDAKTVEKAITTIERLGGDVDNWLDEIRYHFYPPDYTAIDRDDRDDYSD